MFYSQDILTSKRRSGLAVVWLAATLGPKHSFKKLSKREVNGVNLVKACDFLTDPPEPMALRLTSNLMVGVTRVYSQQYTFFHTEVKQVFMKLKRAWTDVQSGDVDMPAGEARFDAITLQLDEDIELRYEPPIALQNTSMMEKQIDFGWVVRGGQPSQSTTLSPSTATRSPSAHPSNNFDAMSVGGSSHVGSLKSITLQTRGRLSTTPLRSSLIDTSTGMGFDLGFDPLLPRPDESGAGLSILLDDQFDLFANIRDDHEAARKRRKIRAGSLGIDQIAADGFQIEQSVLEPSIEDTELGFVDVRQVQPPQEAVDRIPPGDPSGDLNAVLAEAPPKPRKSRRRYPLIDLEIELPHDEMVRMRNRASYDLLFAEKQAQLKARVKADKAFLQSILDAPPIGLGPDLRSFWHETVLANKRPGDGLLERTAKRLKQTGHILVSQDSGGAGAALGLGYDIDSGSFENSRADLSAEDLEVFRAGDERRKSEIMPWHRTSRAGSVASDQPGSVLGSARKSMSRRDSFSTFGGTDDFAFEPMRRRSTSMAGSARDFSPLKDLPDFEGFSFDAEIPFKDVDMNLTPVDSESSQFLNYVKTVAPNADTSYGNNSAWDSMSRSEHSLTFLAVHFFDVLPPSATSRAAASQGFYHVLVLATRGVIQLTQTGPYQDISLGLDKAMALE
ncbi:hypothetical protein SpCBS45565_g07292 [Spizellomyces sp. 'palustris']|nr:hypothetical protein SpCBS45565_g07292 [Spizellomyces sp. 'palustris']